jgi:hypothetical protein
LSRMPGSVPSESSDRTEPVQGNLAAGTGDGPSADQARGFNMLGVLVSLLVSICALLWAVWRTGPGKVPSLEIFAAYARSWPVTNLPPQSAYVLRLPVGQAIYHALFHTTSTRIFLAVHLAALATAAAALLLWFCVRLGVERGLIAGSVILLAPVFAVEIKWIGIYDAFSILCWIPMLFALWKGRTLQFLTAVAAGCQDFEQVFVGTVILLLIRPLSAAAGARPRGVYLLAGAVTGREILAVYLDHVGAISGSRLSFIQDQPEFFLHLLQDEAMVAPVIVFSGLAGLWAYAIPAFAASWPTWSPLTRFQLVAAVIVWLGTDFITSDHTRVLALTSFPCVVLAASVIAERSGGAMKLIGTPRWWLFAAVQPVLIIGGLTLPLGFQHGAFGFL